MADPLARRSSAPVVQDRRTSRVQALRTLTKLLDSAFQVPGTRFRFGLDPIIGIIPGIGDAIGAVLSAVIVFQAARLGISRSTLLRMMGNVVLDTVIGEIPVLGDLFDAGWKANTRNLDLLEAHLDQPAATASSSRRTLLLVAGGLALLLAAAVVAGFYVAKLVITEVR
jgi:Domain of unknown function (DUF4112)